METLNHRAYQVTQLACIVNQLHRMAMRMPPDALPSGMTISQLSTIGFLYFSQQGDVYQKDIESFFKLHRQQSVGHIGEKGPHPAGTCLP